MEENYKRARAAFVQDPAECLQTISESNNIALHKQTHLNDAVMMTETREVFHVWLLSVSRQEAQINTSLSILLPLFEMKWSLHWV